MADGSISGMLIGGSLLLTACGLLSLVLSCCAAEDRSRLYFQRVYTICLVTVGACTLWAVGQQDACWVISALAYAGLAVGATWEGHFA